MALSWGYIRTAFGLIPWTDKSFSRAHRGYEW